MDHIYRGPRRPRMSMSPYNTNSLVIRNPYQPMWWSAAMPGAGHIMIGKSIKGFLLFIFEFTVNLQSGINEAIEYSMVGQFQMVKDILDLQWLFVRLATEINQFAALASKNKAPIEAFRLDMAEINYLNYLNPWVAVVWSLFTPGLGHLISRNIIQGVYLLAWFIVVIYQSKALPSVYFTATGHFEEATNVIHWNWVLYLPSLYLFAVDDCWSRVIESNRLFQMEQTRFLKDKYQNTSFPLL
ncbi:hypothetical protein FHS18_001663 [Paenibacillus phyllosphaerae]|uniref:Uncharacterized protein n=1 Tax=Paenibacillus phyllosphaerae TaxID=274593 RepID=A0A7W5FLU1_9BACL|nr:hypothetical protein [Paenibacillus phyllosphaerae]MBB3109600.1 hypothetical protein [Paenibacillus phyllosphaerae]